LSHRRVAGFTLIEVMVALVIVALTLAAGMRAAASLSLNAERLASVTLAQWCAENQLVEMRLSKQFPSSGDSEFECRQQGRVFKGLLQVKPTPNPNFRRVETRLLDERDEPVLSLSTIVGRY
jgi:general secretion pathway protein I